MRFDGTPGGEGRHRLERTIRPDLSEIDRVNAAFNDFAVAHGLAPAVRRKMNLVFDELLNNTMSYGFDDGQDGVIEIDVEVDADRLVVTIRDNGRPFNPFGAVVPDTTLSVDERQIGGLGVHLVRNVMDEFAYHRQTDRNVIVLTKRLTATAQDAE